MKKTSLIVNVVLALAIVALYVLYFFSGVESKKTKKVDSNENIVPTELKVAYIKLDSLLLNYKLAKDLHAEFTQQQEEYTKEYTVKRQRFEKDAVAFQEKVQRGGFLTQERAISERDRLAGQEKEIQQLEYELTNKLNGIQQENNKQLYDSITSYIKVYNEDYNYTYILNATDILVGEESLNITGDILEGLNARYDINSK